MVSDQEHKALFGFCRKARSVLEIGIYEGHTAKVILKNTNHITRYVGIDVPFEYKTTLPEQQREVLKQPGLAVINDPRFELIIKPRGSYDLTVEELLPKFDVIFIDGDHSREGIENDTTLAYELIDPLGVIVWHDYGSPGICVKELVDGWREGGRNIELVPGTRLAFHMVGK